MLQAITLLTERNEHKVAIACRHMYFLAYFDACFLLQSVSDEVFDGDNLHIPLFGKNLQLWHTSHSTILVHDFHQSASRIQSCQLTKVNSSLCMTRTAQHSIILSIERVYMSWASESRRL